LTTEEIIKMAFELGMALTRSQQMENMKNAQDKLTDDQPTYDLVMRYEELKTNIENKLNDKLLITKTEEDHLSILEQQINNNNVIHELVLAQEKFEDLLQGVYMAINQAIAGAVESSNCGSDCNSCGGNCVM
jgi:cell fate (sporulation/competence/biofilm development) regulator YlbF (YheA/YmcA/DUF963 family)